MKGVADCSPVAHIFLHNWNSLEMHPDIQYWGCSWIFAYHQRDDLPRQRSVLTVLIVFIIHGFNNKQIVLLLSLPGSAYGLNLADEPLNKKLKLLNQDPLTCRTIFFKDADVIASKMLQSAAVKYNIMNTVTIDFC